MHPQIEKYLQQVSGELKSLSDEQRTAELREIGQHLQALTDEGRERGLNETAAVAAALIQFGPYRKVGRDLNQAVSSKLQTRLPRTFTAIPFIMIAQVLLGALASYGYRAYMYWAEPELWARYSLLLGGTKGMMLQAGSTLAFLILTIALALSLRQLRPWAFWSVLALMGWKALREFSGTLFVCAALAQHAQLSGASVAIFLTNSFLSSIPTLFCLCVLGMNRKTYLRLARA